MARIVTNDYTGTVTPRWAGDYLDREHVLPGGAKVDTAQFRNTDAVVATVGVAGAAQGATSVPVAALAGPIPNGTILDFTGSGKFAKLTAAASAGATSLTVEALPQALSSGDTATYAGVGMLTVPSGTLVGRTFTERANGDAFGPATDTDDEIYIVVHDVTDALTNADVDLYRHGSLVKENFLPGWSALSSDLKAEVRARYQTTIGAD